MFSGIKCEICGMALESPDYLKHTDSWGQVESLYWVNPKISDLTDSVVYFCGPNHSLEWYQKAIEAKKVATHDNVSEQSQPIP